MAVADLDYVQVVGRFAAAVGDQTDADAFPDVLWCNAGSVSIEPLIELARIPGFTGGPVTVGAQVITASINSQGWLTWNGQPSVWVVDLTSAKVNPSIAATGATHRVRFTDVSATLENGTVVTVKIPDATVRIAGPGPVDLTLLMPLNPGAQILLTTGPTGPTGPIGATGPQGTPGTGTVNVPDLGRNLLPNPTAGLVSTGFFNSGAFGAAGRTLAGYEGRTGVTYTTTSAAGGLSLSAFTDYAFVTPGVIYTASQWVKASAAMQVQAVIQHDNAAGTTTLSTAAGPVVTLAADTWTRMSAFAPCPTGGGRTRVVLFAQPTAAGQVVTWSSLMVHEGPTALDYFDGSMPGHYWAGTAHASVSVKALYDADDVVRTEKTPELARNLALNPSPVGNGFGGWIAGDPSPIAYGTDSGIPYVQYTADAGSDDGTQRAIMRTVGLATGENHTATVEVWINRAGGVIYPEWVTDGYAAGATVPGQPGATLFGGIPAVTVPANTWVEVSFTRRVTNSAPNNAVGSAVQWLTSGLGADGALVRFRRARMIAGTRVLPHFDGDTPGARWTGVPGASPSVKALPLRHETLVDAPELARNLLVSTAFERGPGAWTIGYGSTGVVAPVAGVLGPDGSAVAAITNATAGGAMAARLGTYAGTANQARVVAGRTYTYQVRVRHASVSRTIQATIYWHDASGGLLTPTAVQTQTTAAFSTIVVRGVAPTGAAGAVVQFDVLSTVGVETFYFTNPSFTEGPGTLPPFNGDMPGCRWAGTPNLSESVRVLHGPADEALLTWLDAGRAQGVGSPEGVVPAPVGTRYVDTLNTNGATSWVKVGGTGNTGWRVVHGNTGSRRVETAPGLLAAGWTCGYAVVRRDNGVVTARFSGLRRDAALTNAAWVTAVTLPAGFGTDGAAAGVEAGVTANAGARWQLVSGDTLQLLARDAASYPANTPWELSLVFHAASGAPPWPTTLPGAFA